ncbi:hypothetical protein CYL16_01175 [Mycobacterium sp. EPG1]|nr:hypothetical protein CYL16_01175 [Mycobacterium sp. EPG1]
MLMQLANRTIGYAGQVAGIGVDGLLETFTLGGSDGSSGRQESWIGRIAAGFAGAGAQIPTTAGNTETPMKPKMNEAQQGAADAKAKGANNGPTVNIEQFVQAENRNGTQAAADLAFRSYAQGRSS